MAKLCLVNIKNLLMKVEPQNSLSKSTFFNLASWILPILIGFISTPIILSRIGDKKYGLFMLILGFVSYSFTFNIGRAVTKFVAEENYNDNNNNIWNIISATLFVNLIVGMTGFIVISLTTNYLVNDLFLIDESLRETAKLGFYVAGFTVLITMLSQVFSAILQGVHRFDIFSSTTILSSVLLALGNILLVFINQGIEILLIWNLLVILFSGVCFFSYSRRYFKIINFKIDFNILKKIVLYSFGVSAYQLFGNILLLFERSWITRNFGEENLTYYVVPMTLGIYIQSFVASLTLAIFPIASKANADKNDQKILQIYKTTTKVVCAIVCFLCVTAIASNKLFLTLYVGKTIAEKSSDLLIIQVITFSLIAIAVVSWMLVEGVKNAYFNAFQSFLWLFIAVPVMIYLTKDFETYGIAVGRLIGVSIIPITILISEKWIFGKILWAFWTKSIVCLIFASFGMFILEKFIFQGFVDSWFRLIIGSLFGLLTFAITLLVLRFFTQSELFWMRNIVK